MISCSGRACLKLDRCCKLEISKDWISVKPRAADLAVAKMDVNLIGISSFCSSCQKSSVNNPGPAQCWVPVWSVQRKAWRAREREKRGNGAKGKSNGIPTALTVSWDFIVDVGVDLLCSGSSAFLLPSSGHGSIMVSISGWLLWLLMIMLPR